MSPNENQLSFNDIKRKSIRGGIVTFIFQGANVLIHLASTIVLARILEPHDYGMIAMVASVTVFAGLFRDFGLSTASIQNSSLTHQQMSNLFWINVLMGSALTFLLSAMSPLVARFYNNPQLTPLTILLSTSFIVNSLSTQHNALLQRNMQFVKKNAATLFGSVITFAISTYMAIHGFRYWSLAWGTVLGSLCATTIILGASPFRPNAWRNGAGIRSMLKLGANVTAFDFFNYFSRNLDNVLIGRFWGADALGVYNKAYQLLMFPITNLRTPINSVALPALSRLQKHPVQFRAYYRRIISLLALSSMPLTAFLFIASESLIIIVLGEKWIAATEIFSILAVASFLMPVSGTRGVIFLSTGKGKEYFTLGMVGAIGTSAGFIIGLPWGASGVAWGYAISMYIIQIPAIFYTINKTFMTFDDLVAPAVLPGFASILAAFTSQYVTPLGTRSSLTELMICLICFCSIYIGISLAFVLTHGKHRNAYMDGYWFIRQLLVPIFARKQNE